MTAARAATWTCAQDRAGGNGRVPSAASVAMGRGGRREGGGIYNAAGATLTLSGTDCRQTGSGRPGRPGRRRRRQRRWCRRRHHCLARVAGPAAEATEEPEARPERRKVVAYTTSVMRRSRDPPAPSNDTSPAAAGRPAARRGTASGSRGPMGVADGVGGAGGLGQAATAASVVRPATAAAAASTMPAAGRSPVRPRLQSWPTRLMAAAAATAGIGAAQAARAERATTTHHSQRTALLFPEVRAARAARQAARADWPAQAATARRRTNAIGGTVVIRPRNKQSDDPHQHVHRQSG